MGQNLATQLQFNTSHLRQPAMASGKIFLLASILVLLAIHNSPVEALSCNLSGCSEVACAAPKCKGGLQRKPCSCCDTCASLEGESCGGRWNRLGRCDVGLTCYTKETNYNYGRYHADGVCTTSRGN